MTGSHTHAGGQTGNGIGGQGKISNDGTLSLPTADPASSRIFHGAH